VLRSICRWSFWIAGLLVLSSSTGWAQGFTRTVVANNIVGAFSLDAGDLDGDGDMDIAVSCMGNGGGTIQWLENQTDSLVHHTLNFVDNPGSRGIAIGDVDQDGDSDIVVAAYGQGRFICYENVGGPPAGMFVEHTIFTARNPWSVSIGDADGDGRPDLLFTDFTGNTVRIMHLVNGTWVDLAAFNSTRDGINHPYDAVLADLNGDGILDIVGTLEMKPIYWVEQSASHTWRMDTTLTFGTDCIKVAVADLDGDGRNDIAATVYSATQITWWRAVGASYQAHTLTGSVNHVRDMRVADLDQDGRLDLVASDEAGSLLWWRNIGGGNFQIVVPVPMSGTSYYGMGITDFDRDGDPDILVADYNANQVVLYRNTMGIPACISGVITTADQQPVANARVRLAESGVVGVSDANGRYLLAARAGTYTMTVSHACFNPEQRLNVEAMAHDTVEENFTLVRGLLQCAASSVNMMARNHLLSTTDLPITNPGDGYLRISAMAQTTYPNDNWLHVSPDTLLLSAGQTGTFAIQVEPDTSDAQGWDYAGDVTLRSNSCPDSVRHIAVLVYVLDAPAKPAALPTCDALLPVYPNPFNLEAMIRFELKNAAEIELMLYDVNGRLAQQLAHERLDAGAHQVALHGGYLTSGVYFVMMQTPHAQFTQKVLLLK
jgi:hypothetical protein